MSKDQSSSKRKLKFSIEPVRVSDQDQASVRRVLGRLSGRVPFPDDAEETAQLGGAGSVGENGSTESAGTTTLSGSTDRAGTTEASGTTIQPGNTTSAGTTARSRTTAPSGTTKRTGSTRRGGTTARGATLATPVSPERDFHKVPNSITREALAAGLFKGKSKAVWDYLWRESRGAIVPSRTVRRSRPQIKAGAGFGSMGTVDAAVRHLQAVGLISVTRIVGEADGNVYEVFTPEEVAARAFSLPESISSTDQIGSTETTRNSVVPVVPESGSTGTTSNLKDSDTSGGPKTSFKTKDEKFDDEAEAFAGLLAAERELTGKHSHPERWGELVEVLVTELKIAAGRTTVSSVPAFLAEHLRRRLWKKDKRQLDGEGKSEVVSSNLSGKVDASRCPDCFGTGMYYPEGYDKGVAKCPHAKLTAERSE